MTIFESFKTITNPFKKILKPVTPTSMTGGVKLPPIGAGGAVKVGPLALARPSFPVGPLGTAMKSVPKSITTPTTPTTQFTPSSVPQVTPAYDNKTGLLTDYGRSQGLLEVNAPKTSPATPEMPQGDEETPTSPTISSDARKALELAQKAYQQSLQISPDELSTQGDLDRLIESTKKGYQGTKDKTIPMEFITGQLASIEQRALNLAEPLEQKLSRLQSARMASIESSKFALDRADQVVAAEKLAAEKAKSEAEEAKRGTEVGGNIVRYNPQTGKYETIYTGSEGKLDTQIAEVGGQKVLINTQTGEVIRTLGSAESGGGSGSNLLSVSEAKSLGVPYGTTEAEAIAIGKGAKTATGETDTGSSLASNLVNSKGLKYAVGTGLGRGVFRTNRDRTDFVNQTEQLLSYLTMNTFLEAKAKGATFGAMSNAEWDILRSQASQLGNARVITGSEMKGNKRVIGYRMSEKAMKDWLESLSQGGQQSVGEGETGGEDNDLLSQYGL